MEDTFMKIKFLIGGESPDFGCFDKGEIKDLPPGHGQILIDRGIAAAVDKKKEVKKHE